MKTKELDLLHDKVPYLFRNFAIPGILSSLSMCLYGIINGIILGRYVGSNAMAAVNMASPIFNIISCIAIMIAIGGNTLVSIRLGEKDYKKAIHHFNNAVTSLFVIAFAIWLTVICFPTTLAKLVGANDVLLPYVKSYIQTFGFFIVPVLFNIIFGISLQSIGKPHLFMIGSMLSMALNIILDLLFICVFDWGVFGAALASGSSATIVFLIFLPQFMRKTGILKIGIYKFDWKAFVQMVYNGSSEAITQFCLGVSTLLFNWILIKRFGEMGVSAFAVVQYISLVINAVILGMSRGVTAVISVNYGAKAYNRVRGILRLSIKTVTLTGVGCTIFLLIFKNQLIAMFVRHNQEVFSTAQEIIMFYSFTFIFVGANVVINTFYTAINDPKTSAILAILRYFLLMASFVALPFVIGNIGLWLSFAFAEVMCLLVSIITLQKQSTIRAY